MTVGWVSRGRPDKFDRFPGYVSPENSENFESLNWHFLHSGGRFNDLQNPLRLKNVTNHNTCFKPCNGES